MTTLPATVVESQTTYDEMPYEGLPYAQTHPNRLAAVAKLFGLNTASPSRARVLEIGCGDGGNLLPMAEQMPGATFLGLDASRVQIDLGLRAKHAVKVENIDLRAQDLLDFSPSEGKFDFIIAHGIFSWVPENVRDKILAICRDQLADNGVALVSYNSLPGWNMRGSLRDMMRFHARGFSDPASRVRQARLLLKFLAGSTPPEKGAFSVMLKRELDAIEKTSDSYVRHEFLEDENTAYYFHEFCARIAKWELQYLGEPSISQMLASNFSENVSKTLGQVGNNIIAQEQYMDFLRNRVFRYSILCKQGIALNRNLTPDHIRNFALLPLFKGGAGRIDLQPNVAVDFEAQGGHKITTSDPFLKAAFELLQESNARALAYGDLLAQARARSRVFVVESGPSRDRLEDVMLARNLLATFTKGMVEILAEPVQISVGVPSYPAASPLMRYQAVNSRYVTNRAHQAIPIDGAARCLIEACDGTRNSDQLLEKLIEHVQTGRLQVAEARQRVSDPPRVRDLLGPQVQSLLTNLARHGFFGA